MTEGMAPLRVAGVPEAFNDCWDHADFAARGLVSGAMFVPHPGGSGAMLKSVISGQVDAAFALTDCIVAAIENGSPVRLAGPLVKSPLTWAVTVANKGSIGNLNDLSNATWGVSRIGSGSHVMVHTVAKKQGWTDEPSFKVCSNFEGLRKAVNDGVVDAFLWEHFTTRPFEEKGEVRIIDGVPTPWDCFSVVVREDCQRVHDVFKAVDAFLEAGRLFLRDETSITAIATKYSMSEGDAKAWKSRVQYASPGERQVAKTMLESTRQILFDAGVIKSYQCPDGIDSYNVIP